MGNMPNMTAMNQFDQQSQKKAPNPNNYKIVKCKNFETSKIFINFLSWKLQIRRNLHFCPWRYGNKIKE
jgi:hypothetical protein